MTLGMKIMTLRKKCGWSQEELAEKLNVSRQSVSKWEADASVPDLEKIVKLAQIFKVTTDYLLICGGEEFDIAVDDNGDSASMASDSEAYEAKPCKTLTMNEALEYLTIKQNISKRIAAAIGVCIVSPIPLIYLGGLSEYGSGAISEYLATGVGVAILLIIVAIAVAAIIINVMKSSKFEFLETEAFSCQGGVIAMARERKETFGGTFRLSLALGVTLCILSPVPLFIGMAVSTSDLTMICAVCLLLVMVAVAVFMFVSVGIVNGSYDAVLQEGDYTWEKKQEEKRTSNLSGLYWCLITAVYLGYSFLTNDWGRSWIIWPVAGVLFACIRIIESMLYNKRNND